VLIGSTVQVFLIPLAGRAVGPLGQASPVRGGHRRRRSLAVRFLPTGRDASLPLLVLGVLGAW